MRITKEGLIGYNINDCVYIWYNSPSTQLGLIIDIDINNPNPYFIELNNKNKERFWINAKNIDHQRTLANMFK